MAVTLRPAHRALISVSDKTGLIPFARSLTDAGVEIVASDGTAAVLNDKGIATATIAEVTGFSGLAGGRVKTLHPHLFAAVLADLDDAEHMRDLVELEIEPIQLVVVNLYPFEARLEAGQFGTDELIDSIDVGGAALLRAAAKNHRYVAAVSSPDQYEEVAEAMSQGGLSDELRLRLAQAAFFATASYDAAILGWLESGNGLPDRMVLPLIRNKHLRYGENPHQEGAAYQLSGEYPWWSSATQLQGKELSLNNLVDADAAWRLVNAFDAPAAAIVKHGNPCGVAVRANALDAFEAAWACDPLSAFGGVVALNSALDEPAAVAVTEQFIEVLVAPEVTPPAQGTLQRKSRLRLLVGVPPSTDSIEHRPIAGGILSQTADVVTEPDDVKVVSHRHPSDTELRNLRFAMLVAAWSKSNSVVVAADDTAVGIGAGSQSRVGAAERALRQAGNRSSGAVAASDAFLPFRDTVDLLAGAGVTAIMQPEGSKRDDEIIAACDSHEIALVFTNRRHFRH